MTEAPNAEQAEFWTHGSGLGWIKREADLDAAFAPVNDLIADALAPVEGKYLIDIGCGTGATSRALAARGAQVHATDISETLLAAARASAAGTDAIRFSLADGQTADLGGPYDAAFSRFGVMFFADPVAAFANIRSALKPGGQLAIACWGPFKHNPWFTIPRFAATDRLGRIPPFNPRAPGPFAFAETDYVLGILKDAGFTAQVDTHTVHLTPRGGAEGAADLATRIGPAQTVVREKSGTEADMQAIAADVTSALADYETDGVLRIPAKIHLYTGTA